MEYAICALLLAILMSAWHINQNLGVLNENLLRIHDLIANRPLQKDFTDEKSNEIAEAARRYNSAERERQTRLR